MIFYNNYYIYPKLNEEPNLAGIIIIIGKKVKLMIIKNIPIIKNIAKYYQLVAAYYTSLTLYYIESIYI